MKNQGFSYVEKDWAGFHMENEVFKLYKDVTFVNDGINGNVAAADYRRRIRATTNNKYEWMYLAAHSSPTDHYFKDGLFSSKEIEPLDVQILFYLNFNCSAARFTDNDCLCNWYVMQEPYGLFSGGSTKGSSMLDQYDYYGPLSKGFTFGEAFKYWGIRHFEKSDWHSGDDRRGWHYGLVCIGDPTLKLGKFMAKPGPRFCYAVTPERDAKIDSTTPVFKWTKTDSADSYEVIITSSRQPVWNSYPISDILIHMPDGFLQLGSTYKWKVNAYSGTECIDFTQPRKFTVRDTNSNYLSDFDPEYYHQDWGTLRFNTSCDGNPLTIAGQQFEKGLGTHANSIIRYKLNGRYKWLTAYIGHDDESNGGDGVTFEVKLDDEVIYISHTVFMWGIPAEYIKLDVANGDKLELLVHSLGDINYDHADWANARLWKDSVKTGIENNISRSLLPEKTMLIGNYPNPFNSCTTISFIASPKFPISLVIYNALGQKVRTLVDQQNLSGAQTVTWDGTNDFGRVVTSGVYFCRIVNRNYHKMRKIILLR